MVTSWSIDRRSLAGVSRGEIRDMNRSASTTTRVTSPEPTTLPSRRVPRGDGEAVQPAVDVRRRRGHLEPRRRPGWRRGARAGRGCRRWSRPSARAGSISAQVAASHHASSRGVPSTGRLPDPSGARGVVVGDGELSSGAHSPGPVGRRSGRRRARATSPARAAGEAEPLVEPVGGGHPGHARQHHAGRTLARGTGRALPRPAPRRRRCPCACRRHGEHPELALVVAGDLAPRRARRAERHACRARSRRRATATQSSASRSRGGGVAQLLDVASASATRQRVVRRDASTSPTAA